MRIFFCLMLLVVPWQVLFAADETPDLDKAPIEAAIASYVAAFNKGDAAGLAAHWSEQGEFITSAGEKLKGQKQLTEGFAAYFEGAKDAKLELSETQIELQSPGVAVETGTARVIVPDEEPSETVYKAIHVKTADGWKMDRVTESELPSPPPSHYEQLQELAWMVGKWGSEDSDKSNQIETTCRWTSNQNFLVQTFKVYIEDRVDFEGTQVIGWDPHAQTIRSWTFDSDGGFGAGKWTGGEGRWTVNTLNVLPDGRRGSSTNIYEVVDENTIHYRSIGRQVDGELLPSIGPVTVVRAAQE